MRRECIKFYQRISELIAENRKVNIGEITRAIFEPKFRSLYSTIDD